MSLSIIIRRELSYPHRKMSGHIYNTVLTAHALIIIFFIVMPTLIGGFGNYFIPLMLGIPDLVFPRLNLLRLWLLPSGMILLLMSLRVEGGRGTG